MKKLVIAKICIMTRVKTLVLYRVVTRETILRESKIKISTDLTTHKLGSHGVSPMVENRVIVQSNYVINVQIMKNQSEIWILRIRSVIARTPKHPTSSPTRINTHTYPELSQKATHTHEHKYTPLKHMHTHTTVLWTHIHTVHLRHTQNHKHMPNT